MHPPSLYDSCRRFKPACLLLMALCMAGCGGAGTTPAPAPAPPPIIDNPGGAGHFESASFIATIDASAIAAALAPSLAGVIKPVYAVDAYKLTYTTSDANGRMLVASGLVALPRKPNAVASPVMGYQHASINMDAEAPSNHAGADEPAILFASLGYQVSAADYVGYGLSKGQPHPYLLAAPLAASVVDFLGASERWRRSRAIADNGQLFLTGYSEGAYATMAALRQLTENRTRALPVATFLGVGPYNVVRTLTSSPP
jgi:hypothetical protein